MNFLCFFRCFNIDSFKRDLQEINWNFATENSDVDLGFETFYQLLNKALDRHAPIKNSTRKEEKIKSNPWITKGIKISISIRNKLYKAMVKEKNVLTKVLKYEFLKKYWNQIINLLKVNKHITISTLKKTKIVAELYGLVSLILYAHKIRKN